ncbi:MAG: hypothetical protein QNJ57_10590, partial [Flavobacteriaceae bacterium]|nr:hypothetical protein [Flavobacteriaceae bacterium]
FYEINEGIGVHKSPELYGAFPTDPYSHTPTGKGAQQPGMTGQVKEDILSRFGELGVFVKQGRLQFNPCLLRVNEFLKEPMTFNYISIDQQLKSIELKKGSMAFTYCQVPIIYHLADSDYIELFHGNGTSERIENLTLDAKISERIFKRTGDIDHIKVHIREAYLKK